jgi:hypothetical protein
MQPGNNQFRIDETKARAGSNNGVLRWILLISLTLAIVALTAIWVTGALTRDTEAGSSAPAATAPAEAASATAG